MINTAKLATDIVFFICKSKLKTNLSRLIPDVEFMIKKAIWEATVKVEK